VAQLAGVVDDSGIRITYTERLRRHDAGIMELGLIFCPADLLSGATTRVSWSSAWLLSSRTASRRASRWVLFLNKKSIN
jgi:hypothetical protein